jgi:hypothetical protein
MVQSVTHRSKSDHAHLSDFALRCFILSTAICCSASAADRAKRTSKPHPALGTLRPSEAALVTKILARGSGPSGLRKRQRASASRKLTAERYAANNGLLSSEPRFRDDGPWEEQTTDSSRDDSTKSLTLPLHPGSMIAAPSGQLQTSSGNTHARSESNSSESERSDSYSSTSESESEDGSSNPLSSSNRRSISSEPPPEPPEQGEEEWERAVGANLHAFDRKRGRWTVK